MCILTRKRTRVMWTEWKGTRGGHEDIFTEYKCTKKKEPFSHGDPPGMSFVYMHRVFAFYSPVFFCLHECAPFFFPSGEWSPPRNERQPDHPPPSDKVVKFYNATLFTCLRHVHAWVKKDVLEWRHCCQKTSKVCLAKNLIHFSAGAFSSSLELVKGAWDHYGPHSGEVYRETLHPFPAV